MKLLLVLFAIISLIASKLESAHGYKKNPKLDQAWASYKKEHGKNYASQEDEDNRRHIYETHDDIINQHNSNANNSYQLGHNKYSDMSNDEFTATLNGFKQQHNNSQISGRAFIRTTNIPSSLNWAASGYVGAVKDQGQCGSCYAFSALGALEGQTFKKTGKLPNLSEQNIIDCDTTDSGCNGGDTSNVYAFVHKNNGVDTEASYPYKGVQKTCAFKSFSVGATAVGPNWLPAGNEAALTNAIATIGPISVSIDASKTSFQLYKSGVYAETKCSSTVLDHAVLATGYGQTSTGVLYYLVKNSWGTSWGQAGYIQMQRNGNNQCGIATYATYPSV